MLREGARLHALSQERSACLAVFLLVFGSLHAEAFLFLNEGAQEGSPFAKSEQPLDWLLNAASSWMSEIPDETSLSKLSIPGTHDAGARFGGRICETQTWAISEQLSAGIRYFDIRTRRFGKTFTIHHGICFQFISFGDVMEQVSSFLKASPGETIIMRVQEEFMPRVGSDSFQEIWDRYMGTYGDLFLPDLADEIPTLGEVRGKVVVLRNASFVGYGLKYDGTSTDIQDYYQVFNIKKDFPFGPNTVSISQKKRFITEQLEVAKTSSKLVLNHISGSRGMYPDNVAKITNEHLYKTLGPFAVAQVTGVLIMDFPGDKLIYRIVRNNFA